MKNMLILVFILLSLPTSAYAGLDSSIRYLYPGAVEGRDYEIRDDSDGKGPYIEKWNLPAPKPTKATLDAVAVQAMQAVVGRRKEGTLNKAGFKAVIRFLANHHSMTTREVGDELKSYME